MPCDAIELDAASTLEGKAAVEARNAAINGETIKRMNFYKRAKRANGGNNGGNV